MIKLWNDFSRLRRVAAFALLLAALATAPALGSGDAVSAASGPDREALPSPEVFAEALAKAEAEEERREAARLEWLDSPAAREQRANSLDAFAGFTDEQAQGLLESAFADQLQQLDADPARALGQLQIKEVLSTNVARVANGEGGSALVESPIPIEVGESAEDAAPVDLSLQRAGTRFLPENPLTSVSLPGFATGEIELQSGVGIAGLSGEGNPAAHPFGETDLFYPETDASTDTLVAPVGDGVEIFAQLRSAQSPEQFRYELSLPAGATLREDGRGGAEVVSSEGEAIAAVPAPWAVDAQGSEVPVELTVHGNALVLFLPHRSSDLAYPLLLDPALLENAGPANPAAFRLWTTVATDPGFSFSDPKTESELHVHSAGNNHNYPAKSYGQFLFQAPGTTAFIKRATFDPITLEVPGNCASEFQPHGYVGIFNVQSDLYVNPHGEYETTIKNTNFDTGNSGGPEVRLAAVGIGSHSNHVAPCGRDFTVRGVTLHFEDPEAPTLSAPIGPGGPVGHNPRPIRISGQDPGFGVSTITVHGTAENGQPLNWTTPVGGSCTGLREAECPHDIANQSLTYVPGQLPEGANTLAIVAHDPQGHDSAPQFVTLTIDRVPPDTIIDSAPAVEGTPTGAAASFTYHSTEAGSDFECRLDSGGFSPCPAAGFTTGALSKGEHTFFVRATDAAENTDGSPDHHTFYVGPPETTITKGPKDPTNRRRAHFEYEADQPGATLWCRVDGQPFAECPPKAFTTDPLLDGNHSFAVRAINSAGMVDTTPATWFWTLQTVLPDVEIETGPSGLTNDAMPAFTFSASVGTTLACAIDSDLAEPEEPGYGACLGPHVHMPQEPLADGPYTFRVRATDNAENASSDSRSFRVDATPPETTITAQPDDPTDEVRPTFGFASSEFGSTFRCRFDGQAFAPCSGPKATHTPAADLADGPHTFQVRAVDRAGNPDPTPASFPFAVITTGPQTKIDAGPLGAVADTSPGFDYSADEPSTFECRLDGAPFASCPAGALQLTNLSEGEHTFRVRARNAASILDPTPATRIFVVDVSDPTLPIANGPFRNPDKPGLTLHLEVGDGDDSSPATKRSGVGALQLLVDGKVVLTTKAVCQLRICPDEAVREIQVPQQYAIGAHHFVVRGEDGVGHFSPLAEWDQAGGVEPKFYLSRPQKVSKCDGTASSAGVVLDKEKEILRGTTGDDLIVARPGADKIKGLGGCDIIIGKSDADKIYGGPGGDLIRGGRSNDRIEGGPGNDLIYGGPGDDNLLGEGGGDLLDGGPGFDIERGEEGGDTLRGGQGNDFLAGGTKGGVDTLSFADAFTPGAAVAPVPGFTGFPGSQPGVHIDLKNSKADDGSQGSGGGEDILDVKKKGKVIEQGDFERVIGSPFADRIEGTASKETINGGPGPDAIDGGGGAEDAVEPSLGEDFRIGKDQHKTFEPQDGTIEVGQQRPGSPGDGEVDLFLVGSKGHDDALVTYYPDANRVTFEAKAGSAGLSIDGKDGICKPAGSIVNCKLPANARLGALVLYGGAGNDVLQLVNKDKPNEKERTLREESGAFELFGGTDVDVLRGGSLEELLVDGEAGAGTESLSGGGNDDVMIQGDGRDLVAGGGGDDLLVSAEICEGDASKGIEGDSLNGGGGSDNAQFHPFKAFGVFADLAAGKIGENETLEKPGDPKPEDPDHICPKGGFDTLAGIETLEGSEDGDVFKGDGRHNLLIGRGGEDSMFAKGGPDLINAVDKKKDIAVNCGGDPGDHAAYDVEAKLNEKGIVNGCGNESVEPDAEYEKRPLLDATVEEPPPPVLGEAAVPPPPPPISSYFPLDDLSGTSASSGLAKGVAGTYEALGVGPATGGPGPLLGTPGALRETEGEQETSAVTLNGSTDYLNLAGQGYPSVEADGYSVVMFVRFTRPPGQREYLFSSAEGEDGVFLYRDEAGRLTFAAGSDPGAPQVSTDRPIEDENWHLVAGTLSGQTITLNVDGFPYQLGYGQSVVPPEVKAPQSLIGAGPGLTDFLAADVDEFLTYDAAISAAEVFAQLGESKAEEPELLLTPEPETADADGDGAPDGEDNCPQTANPDQADLNLDGLGDACEPPDADGDGAPDAEDNCPEVHNPDQADSDGDGVGDECADLPPTVSTDGATDLTANTAILHATITPGGSDTSYQFEYGPTDAYGTSVPLSPQAIGSGANPVEVSEQAVSLTPGTTYHYRVVASNQGGESEGADLTFTTPKLPVALTGVASEVGKTSATLNGTVNPEGLPAEYQFEYGKTTAYGNLAPASMQPAGEGTTPVAVSAPVEELKAGTTYHYRLRVTTTAGTVSGEDQIFETPVFFGISGFLSKMAVTESFDASAASLSRFAGEWSALGWATGAQPKGAVSTTGWEPADPFPTLNGASYGTALTDPGSGLATVATMAREPASGSGHFSLWLDVPDPQGSRAGYELRFSNAGPGVYDVTLSRWQGGQATLLAARDDFAFETDDGLALVDLGSTVSAWADTGPGYAELLSASDASFASGHAGLEASANQLRLADFKLGVLPPTQGAPPQAGPPAPPAAPAPPAKPRRCPTPKRGGKQSPGKPQVGTGHQPSSQPHCKPRHRKPKRHRQSNHRGGPGRSHR